MVAFLYVQVGDPTEGSCTDIDVRLRLDLAGSADDRAEVLPHSFAGDDLRHIGLAAVDGTADDSGDDDKGSDDQSDLFDAHAGILFLLTGRPESTCGLSAGQHCAE